MTYVAPNKADIQNGTLCRLLSVNFAVFKNGFFFYCISINLLHKETMLHFSVLEWCQLKELHVRHGIPILKSWA